MHCNLRHLVKASVPPLQLNHRKHRPRTTTPSNRTDSVAPRELVDDDEMLVAFALLEHPDHACSQH